MNSFYHTLNVVLNKVKFFSHFHQQYYNESHYINNIDYYQRYYVIVEINNRKNSLGLFFFLQLNAIERECMIKYEVQVVIKEGQ